MQEARGFPDSVAKKWGRAYRGTSPFLNYYGI